MVDEDEAQRQRQARIEARRRRLAAREVRDEVGDSDGDCGPKADGPCGGEPDAQAPRPAMRRMDHQDTFGTRTRAAEGLVDAPTRKPKPIAQATAPAAHNLDLDFASVERATARMKRSGKPPRAQPLAPDEAGPSWGMSSHKTAVLSAEQANRAHAQPPSAKAAAGTANASVAATGLRVAGKVLISDDEEKALHRLMVGPQEEADGVTGAGARDTTKGGDDDVLEAENVNAIDAKAMDRLARQNDELRKLAEAQRRELQRLQAQAPHSTQGEDAHSPAARNTAVADPWQGGLKERGVRKYLDTVAKVQAGVGSSSDGWSAQAAGSALDDEGVTRDQEFEQHLQHLQWQRTAPANSKLPPSQVVEGASESRDIARRRAAPVGKMTDEGEDDYRRERRENELKALGLDPTIGETDLPRAAAAKISELEEELERLRQEEEASLDDDAAAAAHAPRQQGSGHVNAPPAASGGGGTHANTTVDISSSDEEDERVVDEILEHERQAGQAGLGPDEAARLARELGRLKAKLSDADADESATQRCAEETAPALVRGAVDGAAQDAASSRNAAVSGKKTTGWGRGGWGSRLKKLFFGTNTEDDAQAAAQDTRSADTGGGGRAASFTAAAVGAAPAPSVAAVKPPMATPSVQGSMKLSIKVASSGLAGAAAQQGGGDGSKPPPRMMTALPEGHDDEYYPPWFEEEDLPRGAGGGGGGGGRGGGCGGACGSGR